MFDAFIIDRIREDAERRRRESQRPYLEVPRADLEPTPAADEPPVAERGVVIIDRDEV